MDNKELIQLMLDYLNNKGMYWDFVSFADNKGIKETELEKAFEEIDEE